MTERQLLTEDEDSFTFPDDDIVELDELEEDDDEQEDDDQGQSLESEDPEPFKLPKEEVQPPSGDNSRKGQDAAELFDIVHRGQVHRVTKEKAIELAQKGYDYDVKVGPHGKLAYMLDRDPVLAREIEDGYRKRHDPNYQAPKAPEPDPFSGMDDDEPVTAAEARAELKKIQQAMLQRQAQPMPQQQAGPPQIQTILQGRDPANFNRVAPRLQEFASKLSVEDYRRIDSDPAAMVQFYDYVKDVVVGQQQRNPGRSPGSAQNNRAGSFRARSGGGNPSRQKTDEQRIWEMPRAEFEKTMAAFKGG